MYVVITGINSLSKRLVEKLEGSHDVVVIDEDKDKCERLYSSTGATVINKSPSTITALEDAGITKADILISTIREDNMNMVVCSLARKFGVPKVISRVEDDQYLDAFQIIGAETVGHNDILLSEFLSAVEHPNLVKLANISNKIEVVKGKITNDSKLKNQTIQEIKSTKNFPKKYSITAIIRAGEVINALEDKEINPGDEIILLGPKEQKADLDEFFKKQ